MKPFESRLPSWRQLLAAAAAVVLAVVVVVGQMTGMEVGVGFLGLSTGIAVPFTVLGVLVLMSTPRHPVGLLMTAAGLAATVTLVGISWTEFALLAWLGQWPWFLSFGLIFLAILLFPDGQLPSWRWRPVAAVIILGVVVATVGLAVLAIIYPEFITDPPQQLSPGGQLLRRIVRVAAVVTIVGYLATLGSLWSRWRRADTDTRRQLACLLPAGIALIVGVVFESFAVDGAWALTAVAVPLGMAVAILRYRLYDVDLVVNRTIVWFLMTALVVVGVIAIVEILKGVLAIRTESASLMATGLAVVTFQPLHRRVQHGVDRLLYGDRDDPYLVIARLGEVLRRTVEPTAVMPMVTGTLAQSLQVPYVAVELQERDGPVLVAEHGRPGTETEPFDMVSHGERIGRLLVGRRSTGSRFSRHERKLLRDVALHAAVAAEATRLNRDLQTSRERLVMAREEERRRLRRDLHDGLGPSFAGMSMQLRAALRLLPSEGRAAAILDALAADLSSCTTEVRQLVDELRPPALDRGLEAALRAECRRFDTEALMVHCEVHGSLDELPAAMEVAAFRIVAEALTNVTRHSGARTCHVVIRRTTVLCVEIVDDGIGIAPAARAGVGLHSMRERAAELGGDCVIAPALGGGTSVRLELPLGPSRHDAPTLDSVPSLDGVSSVAQS